MQKISRDGRWQWDGAEWVPNTQGRKRWDRTQWAPAATHGRAPMNAEADARGRRVASPWAGI